MIAMMTTTMLNTILEASMSATVLRYLSIVLDYFQEVMKNSIFQKEISFAAFCVFFAFAFLLLPTFYDKGSFRLANV